MGIFEIALLLAALLCTLTAGLLFAFTVIVMPGIARLEDRAFIRAFQLMDGIIQAGQPLFLVVWVGSIVALLIAAVLGIGSFFDATTSEGVRILLLVAALVYAAGVQLPTIIVNIPLNNRLQTLDVDHLDDATAAAARAAFEPRWTRANAFRTLAAVVASACLLLALLGVDGL